MHLMPAPTSFASCLPFLRSQLSYRQPPWHFGEGMITTTLSAKL